MLSWYFRRFRPVVKARVNVFAPRMTNLEDRVTPVADFTAGAPFASNLTNPNALEWPIRAGDFNNDGKQDFLSFAGFGSTEIVSFLGDGAGSFAFKAKLDLVGFATPRSESLVVADFTNPAGTGPDGFDDFAYIDSQFNFFDVWPGNGDGTFTLANVFSTPTQSTRLSMAAGDFNADGNPDLVLGRFGGGGPGNTPGEYEILLGDGFGGFTALERTATANLDFITSQPTVADINRDGKLDFVAVNAFAVNNLGRAGVYYGNGDGTFFAASVLKTNQNAGINDHVVGDFNGDGKPDVALVSGTTVDVYLQGAPGVFPTTPSSSFTLNTAPNELTAADFDFDGRTDIVIAPFSAIDNNIRVYSPDATGTFTSGDGLAFASAGENINITVIDGDANGLPDLLTSQRITSPASTKFQYFDNNNFPTAPVSSTVTVTALPNPVQFGSPVTFTAKVATFGFVPTGTVEFVVDGSVISTGTLTGGKATFAAPGPFAIGDRTYSVNYLGDSNFNAGQSGTKTFTVTELASVGAVNYTTSIPVFPNDSLYGALVSIAANVTPVGSFAPTGSFEFFANGVSIGSKQVDPVTGKAVLDTRQINVGSKIVITAKYTNDPLYADAEFAETDLLNVFQTPTVTDVITSANPSVFGQPVTYTVTVAPDPALLFASFTSPVFSGVVAILDNDSVIAQPTLNAAGVATFTVPADYALGNHTIQVVFAGDANLGGSQSNTFVQVVNKANSQIDLTANANPITFGQDVVLTAKVSILDPGVGSPDGTVTFFQNGISIGTFGLDGSGQANVVLSSLQAGSYDFTAIFSGNVNVSGSTSGITNVVVDPTTSTTLLEVLPNPASLGTIIVASAFVNTAGGQPVNTGSVIFTGTFNGQPFGPFGSPVFNGLATLSFPGNTFPFGSGEISAQFIGDASILDSAAGPVSFNVEKAQPGISLTTSTTTSVPLGSTSKFSVALSAPPGVIFPITGTVSFADNGVIFDTVAVVDGLASSSRVFTLGDHTITATYNGDSNFETAAAPGILFSVFRPTDRFSVGAGTGGPDRVNVYDAAGNVVFSPLFAFSPDYTSGVRVATADFDGDGVQDVAMGTGPGTGSRVRILSGANGAPIADFSPFGEAFTGGVFVNAGDVNGDFLADLVVTPDNRGGARIRLFDNAALVAKSIVFPASIASRADFIGIIDGEGRPDTAFRGGARAAIGDIDGDGFGDIALAAGTGGGPRIAGFSGKTLTSTGGPKLFGDFFAFESKLRNGTYIALGDMDGDGKADLATGAGPGGAPRVAIFTAASVLAGTPTKTADFFVGSTTSRSGASVAMRYLDNDERLDLIVGSGTGDDRVTAFAGTTLVGAFTAPTPILAFDAFSKTPDPNDAFRGTFVG